MASACVGRVVGEVGDEGDEGNFCAGSVRTCHIFARGAQALGDFAIEVRDYGEDEVGGMVLPVVAQQFDDGGMVEANRRFQDGEQLDGETGPALAEDHVVRVLNAQAGGAANQVERVEEFLDVEEGDVPGIFLRGESGFEGGGGAEMSAAGVVENNG
ncbi:MAG: hypothetical protein ABSD53_16160 [Terriglobales bacterium]